MMLCSHQQTAVEHNGATKELTKNKIVLVTGGSRGLGKNIALKLTHNSFDVIITYYRKKEETDSQVKAIQQLGCRAAAIQLNLSDTREFDIFFNQFSNALANDLIAINSII